MKQDSRRGAVEMGTVLMVAAFLVIVGFVYWLRGQAQAERAMEIQEDSIAAAMEDEQDSGAIPITANDITMDASGYRGSLVRLEPQTVASLVGSQGFMLDLPAGPFLVSLSDELIADSLGIQPGDVVRVTGHVREMTPEVAAGWQEAGRLTDAERMVAEFAVDYIAAEDVQVSAPAPENDDGGA